MQHILNEFISMKFEWLDDYIITTQQVSCQELCNAKDNEFHFFNRFLLVYLSLNCGFEADNPQQKGSLDLNLCFLILHLCPTTAGDVQP